MSYFNNNLQSFINCLVCQSMNLESPLSPCTERDMSHWSHFWGFMFMWTVLGEQFILDCPFFSFSSNKYCICCIKSIHSSIQFCQLFRFLYPIYFNLYLRPLSSIIFETRIKYILIYDVEDYRSLNRALAWAPDSLGRKKNFLLSNALLLFFKFDILQTGLVISNRPG